MTSSGPSDLKTLLGISLPISVDLALLFLTFFVDTYFLSWHADLPAAAVGALFPYFGLVAMLLRQVAQAGAVVTSYHVGREDQPAIRLARRVTFWNGIGLGILIGMMTAGLSALLPQWLGLSADAAHQARLYMLFIAPGLLFLSLKHTIAAIHLSGQSTTPNMIAAAIAVAANIALNYLAIQLTPPDADGSLLVRNVALATVASYVINAALLWMMLDQRRHLFFETARGKTLGMLAAIWRKAVPTTFEPAAIQVQWLVITVFVSTLGMQALATRIYVINWQMFVLTWSMAIAIAAQVLTAYEVGRGEISAASRIVRTANRFGALGAAGLSLLIYVFSDPLIGLFTLDPEIRQTAALLFLIAIPTEIAKAIYNTTCWSLIARGDDTVPVVWSAVIMFALGVPLAWYLSGPLGLGLVGIWLAMCIDECLRALAMLFRWSKGANRSSAQAMEAQSCP